MKHHELPVKVIYIMGTGRSGTTIQEVLLASNPDISGVGEVTHLFTDGLLNNELCACGKDIEQCELWSSVLKLSGWNQDNASRLEKLFHDVTSHARFPLVWLNWLPNRLLQNYREENMRLFSSIAELTGCQYIVDSSKYAGRALLLARLFPESVYLVCLTRSPEGLLQAFRKTPASLARSEQRPKHPLMTMCYYIYTSLCFRLVLNAVSVSSVRINYEELREKPDVQLQRIANKLELGNALNNSIQALQSDSEFIVGHIVTGNRLRKKRRVSFQKSEQQQITLSRIESLCFSIMKLWQRLISF